MGSTKIVSNQMKDSVNLPKGKSIGQLGKRPIVNLSQEFSKLTAFIGTLGVVAFGVGIASYGAHSGWWPAGPLSNLSKLYTIHVLQIGGGVSLLTPLGAGAWGILEISHRHLSRSQKEVQVKRPNAKTKTLTEQPQASVQGKQKENPKTEQPQTLVQGKQKENSKTKQPQTLVQGKQKENPKTKQPQTLVQGEQKETPKSEQPQASVQGEQKETPKSEQPQASVQGEQKENPKTEQTQTPVQGEQKENPNQEKEKSDETTHKVEEVLKKQVAYKSLERRFSVKKISKRKIVHCIPKKTKPLAIPNLKVVSMPSLLVLKKDSAELPPVGESVVVQGVVGDEALNASLNIQTKETAKHRQVASIDRGAHPIQRKSPSKLLRTYSEHNLTQRKIGRTFSRKRSAQMMPLTGAFVEAQDPSAKIKASLNSLLDAPSINPESVATFLKTFPGTPTAQDLSNDQGINLVNVLLKKISLPDSVATKNDACLAIFYIILALNPDHPFKIDDSLELEAPWVQTQEDGVYLTTRRDFFENEKIGQPILIFIQKKHPTFFNKPYLFDRKQPECYLIQMGARLCQPWLVDFCRPQKFPYFSSKQSADTAFSELMKSVGNSGDIKKTLISLLNFYGKHYPGAVPPPFDLYNVIDRDHTEILKAFFEIVFTIEKKNKRYKLQSKLIQEGLLDLQKLIQSGNEDNLKDIGQRIFYMKLKEKKEDIFLRVGDWFNMKKRYKDAECVRNYRAEYQKYEQIKNSSLYKWVLNTLLNYPIEELFVKFISKNDEEFVIRSVIKENVIPFEMIRGTSILHVAAKLKKEDILVAFVKDPKFFNNLSIVNSRDESGKCFLHYLDEDPERLSTMVEEFINENTVLSCHLDDTLKAELSETLKLPIGKVSYSALSWVESL